MTNSTSMPLAARISKWLLIILSAMLLLHLVVFIVYAQNNKRAETKVNHDLMIQQVINLIERIYFTKPADRKKVAAAVDIPNVSISIDPKAKWKLQFQPNASLWLVNQKIRTQRSNIHVSMQLPNNQWLNISATILPGSWWWQISLLALEVVVAGAVIFTMWSINRFAKPLKEFRYAADRLGIDVEAQPLDVYGPTLVRETAQAMNKMQKRIQDLLRERTQMLGALSHDLRTPITRMKLRAQFISDPEHYQKTINDLDDMEAMVAEALAFAKHQHSKPKRAKLDLNSLLLSICDDFEDMNYNVTYHSDGKRMICSGRSIALKRAFNNLIGNAIKYGGQAQVNATTKGHKFIVTIDDTGPGLPEDQLDRVFQAFYRTDYSRSRDTGGTGLGLAVAKDIFHAHNATVKLSNRKQGGLRATVEFDFV